MEETQRAIRFISTYFPECESALLAGSYVRHEATKTSDYDILVIRADSSRPYRETFRFEDTVVESFIHTKQSCLEWFERDLQRRKPSLQHMMLEGIELKEKTKTVAFLKEEARRQLEAGPRPLSKNEIENYRYFITDMLDDLIGSEDLDEWIFISNELTLQAISFDLLMNGKWLANGKRIPRSYALHDRDRYNALIKGISVLHKDARKEPYVNWIQSILEKHGGRLDEGYSRGKS